MSDSLFIRRILVRIAITICVLLGRLHFPAASANAQDKAQQGQETDPVRSSTERAVEFSAEQTEHFQTEVVEILKANCLKCHAGTEPKGGLDLTQRASFLKGGDSGPAFDQADPAASLLLAAVRYEGLEMPPTGQLSPKDVEALTKWVTDGLPWPRELAKIEFEVHPGPPVVNEESKNFWSFRKVVEPPVPDSKSFTGNDVWASNEIDQFILRKLLDAGQTPSPRATPQQLIRRAYYDLTGLPPSLEAVHKFEADPSPQAWAEVIDELLESPHYGEQWGRHWLDLVRYAETNSYERDGAKPHVWRYRDYVIQSFNSDKPYDVFVREQLAGDELENSTPETIIATGYYRLGRWDDEPVDPELAYYDDLDDVLTTTGQTFLGLTINCARCHDHKIDPIPAKDYYRMLGFFVNVKRYGNRSRESVEEASITEIALPEDAGLLKAALQQFENEMAEIERQLTKIEDKVRPDFSGVEIDEFQYEENRVRLMEKREGGSLSKNEVNRYRDLSRRRTYLREHRPSGNGQALCVKEDPQSGRVSRVLLRGSPHAHGEEVTPGFPSVLSPPEVTMPEVSADAKSSGRRSVLASWITSPENPLTSRVMVNRIWQYHFGRGLVKTPSDFGFQGTRPTHPELLDWLAARFIKEGWSMKAMHRLIMTSATYQMSSAPRDDAWQKDPTNELFWRFDMRRLTAEEVRDSILWANGTLNRDSMYGPSIFTKIPREVMAGQSQPGAGWGDSPEQERARRSIYIHVKRSLLDPVLESFDIADTDQSCPVRFATTQPTQALGTLNSEFILEQAQKLAELVQEETGSDRSAQVRKAIERVTQRTATDEEVKSGVQLWDKLINEHKMNPDLARRYVCLTMLNLNEFMYID
ncbi:MAG: PSD1 domain-containing protein [Planctomyces sp.]|nr:PSD1 domain-containing protein [Planctomyces sp.]